MSPRQPGPLAPFDLVVGVAAVAAPALHIVTDAMEWWHGGFTDLQLWLNYAAFLPMPWLLFGICAVHDPRPGIAGLAGAVLYGAAFSFFTYTTLQALAEDLPTYEVLWSRLGAIYTLHGGLMVLGGALFAFAALRARWLPQWALWLFLAGLATNLVVALLPVPESLQTVGSTLRNVGLMAMGHAILGRRRTPLASGTRSASRP